MNKNDILPILGLIIFLLFLTYTGHLQSFWKQFKGCIGVVLIGIALSYLVSFCNDDLSSPSRSPESSAIGTNIARTTPYNRFSSYEETAQADMTQWALDDLEKDDNSCPTGCTSHVSGCDIKGNISFDTGEKIYHVPGQRFYNSTSIDPQYGERWFCTESEARANGWRKSFE